MSKNDTRPVGEIFEYCKLKLQVVERISCKGCYFHDGSRCLYSIGITGYCDEKRRNDHKGVIFKRIDK